MSLISMIIGALSTSRPGTSLLFAMSGSALTYLAKGDVSTTFGIFILSLLLCFSTFTVNDLVDAEQDKVNHPNRFLANNPKGMAISVIYYLALIVAYCIVSVDILALECPWQAILILLLFVSYSIVKLRIPIAKNVYISTVNVLFAWYVLQILHINANVFLAASAMLFMTAREILMDIPDISGDDDSLAKRLGELKSMKVATAISLLAALMLTPVLLPSKPLEFALFFVVPIFLMARTGSWCISNKFNGVTRSISWIPYFQLGLATIQS